MVDLPDSIRRGPRPGRHMTASAFREALRTLDWSQRDASDKLGVSSASRISDWATGFRPVPPYIANAVHTHLALRACRSFLPAP